MNNTMLNLYLKLKNLLKNEEGINTIEILIIGIALIALAVFFWDTIGEYGTKLMDLLTGDLDKVQ